MKFSILAFVVLVFVAVTGFLFFKSDSSLTISDVDLKKDIRPVKSASTSDSLSTAISAVQTTNEKNNLVEDSAPALNDASVISEELEDRYRALSENDQYPTLSSRLDAVNARRPDLGVSAEDIVSAMGKSNAWSTRDDPGVLQQKLSTKELNDGRAFVEFDTGKVETLMPGDHLDVPVDSIGQVFDMRVDSVKQFEDGNIMWKGTIMNGEGGTVTITQSRQVTLASVVLREQDFTLESHGEDGWIVDSSVLFKVNPNVSDAIIPPHEDH